MASLDNCPRVLRIPRSDADNGSYVLLYIAHNGSSALDLQLIATEGTQPYTSSIKQSRLGELRAKNYNGDENEWTAILSAVLLRKRPEGGDLQVIKGLETVASVNEDKTLTVTIRKDIGGIMQRLGTISVERNDDAEIELFQWAGIASLSAAAAEDELESLASKYRSQKETIDKLNEQLEDLIKAKEEHENALVEKFSELLNTKKAKIREQQRLLNATNVNPDQVAKAPPAKTSRSSSNSASTESRKRKAPVVEEPEDDEVGFDKMDVDNGPLEESGGGASTTPDRTDEETTAEDEDDVDEIQLNPIKSRPRPRNNGTTSDVGDHNGAAQIGKQDKKIEIAAPPPPRELPFTKKQAAEKENKTTKFDDNEEITDDDDDEL